MQIKTTMKHGFASVIMVIIKSLKKLTNDGEESEKWNSCRVCKGIQMDTTHL